LGENVPVVHPAREPASWKGRLLNGARAFRQALPIILILVVAAALRFRGLNWDDGHWLHPDERQIFFVVLDLDWPSSLAEALSPDSPLNPHFFAYGSLPIYLLKLVVTVLQPLWPALRDEGNIHLIARPLAVLSDLGTIYLVYRLARKLLPAPRDQKRARWIALLAAALVSFAVLHIQLAHFYTADPLMTFFVMLALTLAVGVTKGSSWRRDIALGAALGLALATKISAAPLLLVVAVAYYSATPRVPSSSAIRHAWTALRRMIPVLLVAAALFFILQPYALLDARAFLEDTGREAEIARGSFDVPYTIQYSGTLPYLYPVWQTVLWGLALPLGLVGWAGLVALVIRWLRRGSRSDAILLAWAGPYFVLTGLLYAKHLRYMLPLAPVLCLLAAQLLIQTGRRRELAVREKAEGKTSHSIMHWLSPLLAILVLLSAVAYALLFSTLYASPHSWISASEWIYRTVPSGSTLALEHWDRALPLPMEVDGVYRGAGSYTSILLPLYDEPDDAAKWEAIAVDLADSDYIVIATRRLYGSIPRVPDRYPVATRYYDLLFAGELGFELEQEFTRPPTWLNPRIPPLPDAAPALLRPDESFVVYDHPRALVFRNVEHLPADQLLRRLGLED
jgi:4-amino-4-deoxy-L-arabinose transferase-like glycosyltransferase